MSALMQLLSCYEENTAYAKSWKENGGKVIGYICNVVPEEMIMAAGFLPLRITSCTKPDARLAREKMGRAEGFVTSMASRIIEGDYAFLDYLVVPHARGSVHKMYSVLRDLKKEKELPFPEVFFLDHAHSSYMTSQEYNRDRMLEFAKQLETWSGKTLTQEALKEATAICNETRTLISRFAALRCRSDVTVTGEEALKIIGASMLMDKKEYNKLLFQVLEELEDAKLQETEKNPVRVYFTGTPQDQTGLYALIESCGGRIVAEDHCWGNRAGEDPVSMGNDMLSCIIRRYNEKAPCPSTPPMTRRTAYFATCVERANPEAVVFFSPKGDAQAWDIPDEMDWLKARGIPCLYLEKQKYPVGETEENLEKLENFFASVRGGKENG